MAISVDRIYKSVLTILNREQRGQLRPGQFNKLAQQAQLELLEKAFYDYSRSLNRRINAGQNNGTQGDLSITDETDEFTNTIPKGFGRKFKATVQATVSAGINSYKLVV